MFTTGSTDENTWIMGNMFNREYLTVYDYGRTETYDKRMGFVGGFLLPGAYVSPPFWDFRWLYLILAATVLLFCACFFIWCFCCRNCKCREEKHLLAYPIDLPERIPTPVKIPPPVICRPVQCCVQETRNEAVWCEECGEYHAD